MRLCLAPGSAAEGQIPAAPFTGAAAFGRQHLEEESILFSAGGLLFNW
jgi:hypothetical protein